MNKEWTPFDKHGKLNLTFHTDPWWKRFRAWIRREPLWHRMGELRDGDR